MSSLQRLKTVLIVEDDAGARDMYRQALTNHGFSVITVDDGVAALRLLDVQRPDAVVLDLLLPRLGGMDVYREIRANPRTRHVPVIIITGQDREEVQSEHFRYFLRKPVAPSVLADTVDAALRARAAPHTSQ